MKKSSGDIRLRFKGVYINFDLSQIYTKISAFLQICKKKKKPEDFTYRILMRLNVLTVCTTKKKLVFNIAAIEPKATKRRNSGSPPERIDVGYAWK